MPKIKFQFTANWLREEEERYIRYVKAKIKEARENHIPKMTQEELAKKLGRTQAYFSKLEGGVLVPSIVEVLGIAQHTHNPIQFFLPLQEIQDDQLNGQEWQLINAFRSIGDRQTKEMAVEVVKAIAAVKQAEQK